MAKCIYCGGTLSFLETIDGYHAICREHQQNNKEKIDKASFEEVISRSNSKPNSQYSLNAYIADTSIGFIKVFFFMCVGLLIYLSIKVPAYGLEIFIFGFALIILNFGFLAIFAEIYRHLKEINHKTNHPEKD